MSECTTSYIFGIHLQLYFWHLSKFSLPAVVLMTSCKNCCNGILISELIRCRMPITVYMADRNTKGGLIAICEYGQEYGTDSPVRVLYHGFGHYEGVQIHGESVPPSKL